MKRLPCHDFTEIARVLPSWDSNWPFWGAEGTPKNLGRTKVENIKQGWVVLALIFNPSIRVAETGRSPRWRPVWSIYRSSPRTARATQKVSNGTLSYRHHLRAWLGKAPTRPWKTEAKSTAMVSSSSPLPLSSNMVPNEWVTLNEEWNPRETFLLQGLKTMFFFFFSVCQVSQCQSRSLRHCW